MKKLKYSDFISMFFRSFFFQTAWNFKSLVSIGFSFAMIPVAKRLYTTKEEYALFLKRHLGFFNSHPYFASFALGAIARLEEDSVNDPSLRTEQIEKFKNALIGPLGAVGDQLFWGIIKPTSLVLGAAGIIMIRNLKVQLLFLVLLLILFNVPHIYVRFFGIIKGYQEGYQSYKQIKIERFALLKNFFLHLGTVAIGAFIGFIAIKNLHSDLTGLLVFASSIGLAVYLRNKKMAVYSPILLPLILAFMIGIMAVII
ncbi:MAG: PTS system mannose/fructose/sorbose family transporter subunit IID [Calditrichaceae bacterium]